MQDNGHLTTEEINSYLAQTKKRGAEVLSILGRNQDFVRAFRSSLGQSLLSDAVEQTQALLIKIYDNKADDNEKAEFRAYKRIIELWTNRINNIDKAVTEIKMASKPTRG